MAIGGITALSFSRHWLPLLNDSHVCNETDCPYWKINRILSWQWLPLLNDSHLLFMTPTALIESWLPQTGGKYFQGLGILKFVRETRVMWGKKHIEQNWCTFPLSRKFYRAKFVFILLNNCFQRHTVRGMDSHDFSLEAAVNFSVRENCNFVKELSWKCQRILKRKNSHLVMTLTLVALIE